jgi:hypothetical protein
MALRSAQGGGRDCLTTRRSKKKLAARDDGEAALIRF